MLKGVSWHGEAADAVALGRKILDIFLWRTPAWKAVQFVHKKTPAISM